MVDDQGSEWICSGLKVLTFQFEEDPPLMRDATVPPSVPSTEHVRVSLVDQDIAPKDDSICDLGCSFDLEVAETIGAEGYE